MTLIKQFEKDITMKFKEGDKSGSDSTVFTYDWFYAWISHLSQEEKEEALVSCL
jgi:hypothetical protein